MALIQCGSPGVSSCPRAFSVPFSCPCSGGWASPTWWLGARSAPNCLSPTSRPLGRTPSPFAEVGHRGTLTQLYTGSPVIKDLAPKEDVFLRLLEGGEDETLHDMLLVEQYLAFLSQPAEKGPTIKHEGAEKDVIHACPCCSNFMFLLKFPVPITGSFFHLPPGTLRTLTSKNHHAVEPTPFRSAKRSSCRGQVKWPVWPSIGRSRKTGTWN